MKFLILWDIDGTLINSGGAGMLAIRVAMRNIFGINDLIDDINFAGRTDRWIMRQIFAKFGLAPTEAHFAAFAEAYVSALPEQLANPHARVLPGVRALLAAASEDRRIAQGLLTGNLRKGAEVKLGFHRLWNYFPFGAFADDGEMRNDLGPHALRRAKERHGIDFDLSHVWVVGDTPHDIDCARALGANSLAVATGGYSLSELAVHRPTALLPGLEDPAAFWAIVASR